MKNHSTSLEYSHFPVMLNEVLKITSPFEGGEYIDCTFGGGGTMEKLLGKWHKSRNNKDDLVIIAKGAHTPNCDPKSISSQLTESLDRLETDFADIYIMHRDNFDIPVGEFIDILNEEKNKGRIKISVS